MSTKKWFLAFVIAGLTFVNADWASAQTYYYVNFQAQSGHYVAAESGSPYYLNANRGSAGSWELFELEDVNGGALESGDQIYLYTAHGRYVGQSCSYSLYQQRAEYTSKTYCATETWIDKYDHDNNWVSGQISSGDQVAITGWQGIWNAENGGGYRVLVYGGSPTAWQKFFITW